MTKRRGRGEGSICRRKDGSWVAQYTVGDKRRYIYGKTRKDVAALLSKAIAERDSGIVYDSENLKVADYLDRWLDSIRDTLRERTWRRHEEVARLHLKPVLGSKRLEKLNTPCAGFSEGLNYRGDPLALGSVQTDQSKGGLPAYGSWHLRRLRLLPR